jgi:hypothetical protein
MKSESVSTWQKSVIKAKERAGINPKSFGIIRGKLADEARKTYLLAQLAKKNNNNNKNLN